MEKEFHMKNFGKVFGIIALAALIVLGVMACSSSDDSGAPSTSGSLTITGLAAYNGGYAAGVPDTEGGPGLVAGTDVNMNTVSLTGGIVSGEKVTLKVWAWNGGTKISSYSGNDTYTFNVMLNKDSPEVVYGDDNEGTVTVSFINGVGTGQFLPKGP